MKKQLHLTVENAFADGTCGNGYALILLKRGGGSGSDQWAGERA